MILYINVLLFFGEKSESKDHKLLNFDGLREESKVGSGKGKEEILEEVVMVSLALWLTG